MQEAEQAATGGWHRPAAAGSPGSSNGQNWKPDVRVICFMLPCQPPEGGDWMGVWIQHHEDTRGRTDCQVSPQSDV